jgi:hypothetical protein
LKGSRWFGKKKMAVTRNILLTTKYVLVSII